ncbi:5'-methylthioadenosine/adenosylhomocysteine nucleosidase [uncultured Limosilactobacillus sp.]|uniref:5'-methylthioadenosine/adenosylhomocysteine nucleosidase n=1 Tax=uncultured Limosilactobacillus sp. TaxID=2837629 RepID=UPI0025F5C643|nr:5'-methylthioadenosine/adenosylhomocysteine nucleosidase [uncultured Limosilactobacillus sp.]
MKFGIICAMPEELKELLDHLENKRANEIGGKKYYTGLISGQTVILVESGIGKVEAGITTEHLITDFAADVIINSGSAGGIGENQQVGDIVISTETAYHDADARAFDYVYGQLPGQPARFKASPKWGNALANAGEKTGLKIEKGLIVSGDQFVSSKEAVAKIKEYFPDALSAEMEGAAVGQVATDHEVPYVVVRAMSDTGDEDAGVSFDEFIIEAGRRSAKMLLELFSELEKAE